MAQDALSPVLVGAVIGAAASLLGGWLAGWRLSKLEEEKWLRAQSAEVRGETRVALAKVTKGLAATAHTIMWATYKALTPESFGEEDIARYEKEFHETVSEMVGSQMLLAALDQSLYTRVTPLVSEAISLGGDAYVALRLALMDEAEAEPELNDVNSKALALIKRVPTVLTDLLG